MEPRGKSSTPTNRSAGRARGASVTAGYRSGGPIGTFWGPRLRPLAVVTLVLLGWWAIGPWNYAQAMELGRLQEQARSAAQRRPLPAGPAAQLAASLETTQRLVDELGARVATKKAGEASPLAAGELKALGAAREAIAARGEEVIARIEATGKHLAASSLPRSVRARQRQRLAEVERGLADVRSALRDLERSAPADLPARLAAAGKTLAKAAGPAFHNPLDPEHLPFRTAGPVERTPGEGFPWNGAAEKAAALAAKTAPPGPEDLAETPETELTQGLTDLADSLGKSPLAIYNWVRQNVRFVPTFGSIQGAEGCRLSLECNAFDTASLLVALLRASGVPARYVLGTVEVDPDLFRSALGDFTDIRAAARLASSGGVPTVLVLDANGDAVGVRMDHAWVEAYVDYLPGRGAGAGSPTWVPLDAALKPTTFKAPMDLSSTVGTGLQTLITDLEATATQSADGSSATGLSRELATSRIETLRTDLTDRVDTDLQDATVGDLFGAVENQAEPLSVLPASLPARPLTVSQRTAALTSASRHQVTIRLVDQLGLSESIRYDSSTVELAGKRVTLQYLAATPTDEATIASYGGLLETPPYLIDLKPVLYVDGEVVGTGTPVPMGTFQKLRVSFREPDGRSDGVEHLIAAGTYGAIGLDLQRVSEEAVEQRSQKLAAARAKIEAETPLPFDDVMGEVLNLHALDYFLQVEANNHATANQLDVVALKRPAEMLASYAPVFAYSFGAAVDVVNTGMTVDVRRYVVSAASRTGDSTSERNYVLATGTLGSLTENAIFEQMQQGHAVSAVKLLAEAAATGVPVFVVDQTNAATVVPQLDLPTAVLTDIQNAVAAGKQVITPQQALSYYDWHGVGYVVLDVTTGAAAYLISGGLAGGGTADLSDLLSNLNNLFTVLGFLATIASFFVLGGILGVLANVIAAAGVIAATWYVYNETGSALAALAAFLWAAAGAIYLAAVASALIWSIGLGTTVLAAIAFMFVVTVIVTAIVSLVIYLLTLSPEAKLFWRDRRNLRDLLGKSRPAPALRAAWGGLPGFGTPGLAAAMA